MTAYTGFLFVLAVYLQEGLGYSPLHCGLTYTACAAGFLVASLCAPKMTPVLGRSVLSVGYVLAALGLLSTAAIAAAAGRGTSSVELIPVLLLAGWGMGMGMTPLIGTIIGGLEPADAGSASGIVTTTLQVGGALGVALLSLVFFTRLGSHGDYTAAFTIALPVSAALELAAAVMVLRLPRGPRFANALIERQPGWSSALAYSLFLMTGGRLGEAAFGQILGQVTERRTRRATAAPPAPGQFLAYQYANATEDRSWLNYLLREALAYGSEPVPEEGRRRPVIQMQVDEIKARQAAGLIDPALDPAAVRLLAFALSNYPRVLPQITRMATGHQPDTPEFDAAWEALLQRVGGALAPVPDRSAPV